MERRKTIMHTQKPKSKNDVKILVLGYTGSGKSTASNMIADLLGGVAANTSDKLIHDFSEEHEILFEELVVNKPKYRQQIYEYGRKRQAEDPLYPQKYQLETCCVLNGLRNPVEIIAAVENKLYDLIIWIDRRGCKAGPTDHIPKCWADVTIENSGSLDSLRSKLQRLLAIRR